MTFVLRPARPDDIDALYRMAKSTGGGFTNLPPNRETLSGKLARTAECFARQGDEQGDDLFVFILEDAANHRARGTCQIFSRVGTRWPFYSYRISTITQMSAELDRTFRAQMLSLSTDLDGTSEVGGLWLHPGERATGLGGLIARSRYLFIRAHRPRFADRTIAELRGAHDEAGGSPFWDGLAGRFFGMTFREADDFNAVHGNQFIADLMPKHPIYTALLPPSAIAVMGAPHKSGRAAMRMLEDEGFAYENYVDIFDGGPTMIARTDDIVTIRDARDATVVALADTVEGVASIISHGRLGGFRSAFGSIAASETGVTLSADCAAVLGVSVGDTITHVAR